MDSEDFFVALIEAVRKETILYCKSIAGYMDRNLKQKAWSKVALKIGRKSEECEKWWHLLREEYGRKIRKVDLASGSAASQDTAWPYLESMSFLKECIKRRKTRDNAHLVSTPSEMESSTSSSVNISDDTLMNPPPPAQGNSMDECSLVSAPSTRKRGRKTESSCDREVADKFKDVLDMYKEKVSADESEDDLFMKVVIKMMAPLPMFVKDNIKKQFLDIVSYQR